MVLITILALTAEKTITSSMISKVDAKNQDITNLENDISRLKNKQRDVQYVTRESKTGLSETRWRNDDQIMYKWISPAFSFNSVDEYNKNRDAFIEKLGPDDPFVLDIMPPYISGVTANVNEKTATDEGDKLNMQMTDFTSYVKSIDEEKDIYSYIAFVQTSSSNKNGYTGESIAILSYSIDKDGNVSDFECNIQGSR